MSNYGLHYILPLFPPSMLNKGRHYVIDNISYKKTYYSQKRKGIVTKYVSRHSPKIVSCVTSKDTKQHMFCFLNTIFYKDQLSKGNVY